MKKLAALFVMVCLGSLLLISGPARSQDKKSKLHQKEGKIENSYIVVLDDEVVGEKGLYSISQYIADDMANGYRGKLQHVYKNAINGFAVNMSEEDAEKLSEDYRVKFVEEDAVMTVDVTQNNPPWGLDRIDQRNRPLSATYTYNFTGSGVRVYVIDTGIRTTHTQFGGRASNVFDALGGNGADCNGHGTHVSGTVGGSTYGVAKSALLRGVRVLDCNGSGSTSGNLRRRLGNREPHLTGTGQHESWRRVSSALDTAVNNLSNSGVRSPSPPVTAMPTLATRHRLGRPTRSLLALPLQLMLVHRSPTLAPAWISSRRDRRFFQRGFVKHCDCHVEWDLDGFASCGGCGRAIQTGESVRPRRLLCGMQSSTMRRPTSSPTSAQAHRTVCCIYCFSEGTK
jgi:hypothetical protein